jgi:diguanylate cyclase (GGDEF)-like protein
MATLDPLTKMPNRTLFSERPEQATAHNDKGGTRFAVLFFDLDYFKNINGAIGNLTGDRVIQIAGKRLQTCVSGQGALHTLVETNSASS